MPKNTDIKKVLVIGSGPIIIGQAAEFDYAGTQACRELKKEGIEVVLVNSNPATIMTDKNMADKIKPHASSPPLNALSKKSENNKTIEQVIAVAIARYAVSGCSGCLTISHNLLR